MTRIQKSAAASSAKISAKPTLPRHQLPQPFASLFTLGSNASESEFIALAAQVAPEDRADAARRILVDIALDAEIQEYDCAVDTDEVDPRYYARAHALSLLARIPEHAVPHAERLVELLREEADLDLYEMASVVCGLLGEPALPMLMRVLNDRFEPVHARIAAAEALADIGEDAPELRDRIVKILETALDYELDEPELAGVIIIGLLDLNARESLPSIQEAFEQNRVDEVVVELHHVEEHFGLPHTGAQKGALEEFIKENTEADGHPPVMHVSGKIIYDPRGVNEPYFEEPVAPFVAPQKVGRNEPCPCGSGKKYKKCCGA